MFKLSYTAAKNKHIGWRLWVNAASGFTIERHETQVRGTMGWNPKSLTVVEAKWMQAAGGVWIPSSINIMERGGNNQFDLQFEWHKVNDEVPSEIFTIEGMGLAKGTLIADTRLGGEPIVVGRVGADLHAAPPLPASSVRGRWLLVGVLGTFAATAMLALMYRRMRHRTL